MRLNFRQGIVSTQTGNFLQVNGGSVTLLASNRPVTVTLAHHNTDYLYSDDNTVADAWVGPFVATQYWLYWDFNLLTFERTFGFTELEPVSQSVPPGTGNADITGVIPGAPGVGTFIVSEHYVLQPGRVFMVTGSTSNDGTYTVDTATFDSFSGQTLIVVNETISDPTVDGQLTLDFDSLGNPLKTDGRMWYDTANNIHYVLTGNVWTEVLRVFAAQLLNGNTFIPQSLDPGSFAGTQIGNTNSVRAGRVLFDESSQPIQRDDRTFFTTEDQFFANAARVDAIRLESNVSRTQFPLDAAIASFSPVAWYEDGKARIAQYDDIGSTVVGLLTEDVLINEVGSVIIQGTVTNPNWTWTTGAGAVSVGSELWIENGALVPQDPHVTDVGTYPQAQVPVARVLSIDTVVFEQGLGGKGERGPTGAVEDIPPAPPFSDPNPDLGGVLLSVPAAVPEEPIVVGDLDPRLADARAPLAHLHDAPDVSFTPGAGISANNVEGALLELGTEKLDFAGGIMTGFLTLSGDPTNTLHAVTKNYVDGLVSGLIWIHPVDYIDLVSDALTTAPLSPEDSDMYIIGGTPTGAAFPAGWGGQTAGDLMRWGEIAAQWEFVDHISNFSVGDRFGVTILSGASASGTFVDQNIYELTDPGTPGTYTATWALGPEMPPQLNYAFFVRNEDSFHAFNQFVYNGIQWIKFGGVQAIGVDDITIIQTGNILSVKQWFAGGEVDAKYLQGKELSDLNLLPTTLPYDMAFYWGGTVPESALLISLLTTRNISIAAGAPGSLAVAEVAPTGPNVVLEVHVNGSQVGTVTFATSSTTGTIVIFGSPNEINLTPGDKLQLVSGSATADPDFKDISISFVGCTLVSACTL